jgi:hypothetical protein
MNNKIIQAKAKNPAEIYNEKRRIVFSTLNKDPAKARTYLDGYCKILGAKGYKGLDAELRFFEQYRGKLQLVPSLDAGDATDFSAVIDGRMHRIDVTTNLDYKKLAAYEPLQALGEPYKIAVFDGTTFELVDVNFPFCEHCDGGRVFPTGILLGENHNDHGDSRWSNDQLLLEICGACGHYTEIDRETTHGMFDFNYWYTELNEAAYEAREMGEPPIDVAAEVASYAAKANRYLSTRFDRMLMGVGGPAYQMTNPRDGDGYWRLHFEHVLPLVIEQLGQDLQWDISHS